MAVDLMQSIKLAFEGRDIQRFKKLVARWIKEEKKQRNKRKTTDDVQRFQDVLNEVDGG